MQYKIGNLAFLYCEKNAAGCAARELNVKRCITLFKKENNKHIFFISTLSPGEFRIYFFLRGYKADIRIQLFLLEYDQIKIQVLTGFLKCLIQIQIRSQNPLKMCSHRTFLNIYSLCKVKVKQRISKIFLIRIQNSNVRNIMFFLK